MSNIKPTKDLEAKLKKHFGVDIDIEVHGEWKFYSNGAMYPACHTTEQKHVVPYLYPHGKLELICGFGACKNHITIDLLGGKNK